MSNENEIYSTEIEEWLHRDDPAEPDEDSEPTGFRDTGDETTGMNGPQIEAMHRQIQHIAGGMMHQAMPGFYATGHSVGMVIQWITSLGGHMLIPPFTGAASITGGIDLYWHNAPATRWVHVRAGYAPSAKNYLHWSDAPDSGTVEPIAADHIRAWLLWLTGETERPSPG